MSRRFGGCNRKVCGRAVLLGAIAVVLVPAASRAQSPCTVAAPAARASEQPSSPATGLGRTITLRAKSAPLHEIIDRLAATAGVRISYSTALLPDRRVCVDWKSVALGDALSALLQGSPVEPVLASADHIVLTPVRPRPAIAGPSVSAPLFFPLEPVVVAASKADPVRRHRPVDVEVIEGRELAERSASTVASAMNGVVPGIWVWPSATGLIAQYGSMRGASSFGPSAPRVFIDGIEVANPLLLQQLSADAIERIEVVRGPQGAAWFGTNAINGVTNIVTRHDVAGSNGQRFRVRSALGVSATAFAPASPIGQDHSFSLGLGSAARSAALNVALGTTGDVVPGGAARQLSAAGALRRAGERTLLTATVRFMARDVGAPVSPLLPDSLPWRSHPGDPSNTGSPELSIGVRQYTAGLKAEFAPDSRWRHAFVAGIDGYSLEGTDGFVPLSSAADSALRAAGSGALRGTLRWTSLARTEFGDHATGSLTLTAEHTRLRAYSRVSGSADAGHGANGDAPSIVGLMQRRDRAGGTSPDDIAGSALNTTGLSARGSLAVLDHVSLTGGVRLELSDNDSGIGRFAVLPTLGGTVYGESGPFAATLRAAYGKGVRWPELPAVMSGWGQLQSAYLMPGPEEQAGIEAGFDVSWRRLLSLQVTRFDQTATGLIQRVTSDEPREPRAHATLQNVGSISNRGWELSARATRGRLALGLAATFVDSRVRAVAADYAGDLQPGDRMLAVPAHTIGLNASWQAIRWTASVSAQRAGNWMNYDRIALARHLAGNGQPRLPDGDVLRSFWRRYDGVTHLNASLRRDLPRGLVMLVGAENLLDIQVGEPDNITVLPGRTFSIGIRAVF